MPDTAPPPDRIDAYLFDIGNVLIRWAPEKLLTTLFHGDRARADSFAAAIDLQGLILEQDRGMTVAAAAARVAARAPEHLRAFQAYERRWVETIAGEIQETVAFLRALRAQRRPVFALSNYSADHMELSEPHYPVLREFDGRVISAHEGALKPEPALYHTAIARFDLTPARTFFIDDRPENIETAKALGFHGHCFDWRAPHRLEADLPAADRDLFRAVMRRAATVAGV